MGSVDVDLQNADATSNRLDAWIDFNRDGDWTDPGEQIFTNFDLGTANGTQTLNFTIPQIVGANVLNGPSFARFRLSTAGGLGVTGEAADGEVEDLPVTINTTIIDNVDFGFGTFLAWNPTADPTAYENAVQSRPAGTGTGTATWTFNVLPGTYRVSATWTPFANRATDAPFVVDDGIAPTMIALNQQLAPDDRTENGADWEDLGVFTVTGNQITVTLTDNANGRVVADAIRIEEVAIRFATSHTGGDTTVDENGSTDTIDVVLTEQPATDVVFDIISSDTGEATVAPAQLTFTNANWNIPQPVTVTGVDDALTDAEQFSTITVQVNAALSDNVFDFEVPQMLQAKTLDNEVGPAIIDNGDAGFSTVFAWNTTADPLAFMNDHQSRPAGTGLGVAIYTFNVTPGNYLVSATWRAFGNRATDAPFTVLDGAAPLSTVDLNQQLAPNDRTVDGATWEDLGTFTITGNQLIVQLTDDANGRVIADAIRIEPVP